MSILIAVLAGILSTRGTAVKPPASKPRPAAVTPGNTELARTIKTNLEAIAGPGTVDVAVNGDSHFTITVAVSNFSNEISERLYDRELELSRLFPDVSFDFYFGGPKLARAIRASLESVTGPGTVDISMDSQTLFSVRIAVPSFNSGVYSQICDRELQLYRLFPGLNFDFYLWLRPTGSEQEH